MRLQKQSRLLPVINHDIYTDKKTYQKHNDLLGGGCKRGLIVGSSGCGKTNVMLSLLLHPNGLRFENIYLYSKTLNQSKYQYLKVVLTPISGIKLYEYKDGDNIVDPQKVKPNSIIIFDDVASCNQDVMRDYFSFGRHQNVDSFYLCQTYSKIPKQLLRDNANLLIIFEQDLTNLKHIYNDHVGSDMKFEKFKDMCSFCWKDKFGFLVIDKESQINSGRYRKGFDCYITEV